MNRIHLYTLQGRSLRWSYGVLIVAILVPSAIAQESEWEIQGVDCPKQFELSNRCLALDSLGNPHIAYGRDHLYYARLDGNTWIIQTVDDEPEVGYFAALALDAADQPHISYYDYRNNDLKYAARDGTVWNIERVCTEASLGAGNRYDPTDISLDSQGNPHIVFESLSGFGYAHYDGGTWQVSDQLSLGSEVSLALDSQDNPCVAFYRSSDLRFGTLNGSEWTIVTVAENSGMHPSLVVDDYGFAHISHYDWLRRYLLYTCQDSSGWVTETVDWAGDRSAIALDANGQPSIAYTQGAYSISLKLAQKDSTGWHTETIQQGIAQYVLAFPSIAIDGSGSPLLCFASSAQAPAALLLGRRGHGIWVLDAVDHNSVAGTHVSMALDSSDRPRLSYFDETNRDLKYASWDGSSWLIQTVSGTGDFGRFTSIAIDTSDRPHVTCSGSGLDSGLYYAHWDVFAWNVEVLDETDGYSGSTSAALDGLDRPHIAYSMDYEMRYAVWDGTEWHFETVDGEGNSAGGSCSIALDRLGYPHVCYYASTGMRYASKTVSGWHVEDVTAEEYRGYDIDLALDSQDQPHISYCRDGSGGSGYGGFGPRYVYRDSTGWHRDIIEGWAGVGYYTSISLDQYDRPHISYWHSGINGGKFAWKDGDTWHNGVVDSDLGGGAQTAIAIDRSGYRHIAYFDGELGDLKYAFSTGEGLWVPGAPLGVADLALRIAGPCPSAGMTPLGLFLAEPSPVNVSVFDMGGRRVRIVAASPLPEGTHRLIWDGLDDRGLRVPSGTYICSAEAGEARASTRVVLIR